MQYIDGVWLEMWYALRNPILSSVMFVITLFGADLTILLGAIVVFLFHRINKRRESIIFGNAVILGVLLNLFLKFMFARARPDGDTMVVMDSFSYPSGHAMNAFIFYGLLAYYLIVFTKRQLLEIIIAVCSISTIVLVGISRIYLGVHYPTDVLAGYLAGLWVVMTAVYVNRRLSHTKPHPYLRGREPSQ